MRVLITGAGGFIGHHLAAAMSRAGHDVVASYRTNRPRDTNHLPSTVRWVHLDLADTTDWLPPVDAVIHAAAHTHLVPNSVARDYVRSNVTGTLNLIDYARRVGVRQIVHLSTLSVYGDLPSGELTEDTPLFRPSLYGTTKYLCELSLAENAAHFGSINIRLPGVVAPGYLTPWIGQVLTKAVAGTPITIYNPDGPFNNIVDVEELARFISHYLQKAPAGSATVNLACSAPLPVRRVVTTVLEEAGSHSSVVEGPPRKGAFVINTARLERDFEFEPAPTEAVVRRYVRGNVRRGLASKAASLPSKQA